jgi:hypothetical protein
VTGSYISDIKVVGQDSQAIGGWNGPGPFVITNNYLEAAGENIMFGGADPAIPNLVPSDITIEQNTLAKPPAWRSQRWQVKNLLELKNARRVTIQSNTLEYVWSAAQSGVAILFTGRNQDGLCPWCVVEQVTFESNTVATAAPACRFWVSTYTPASRPEPSHSEQPVRRYRPAELGQRLLPATGGGTA